MPVEGPLLASEPKAMLSEGCESVLDGDPRGERRVVADAACYGVVRAWEHRVDQVARPVPGALESGVALVVEGVGGRRRSACSDIEATWNGHTYTHTLSRT